MLELSDDAICVVFLFDFAHSLLTARDRRRYLRTWGWIDLLSSIPNLPVLRSAIDRRGRGGVPRDGAEGGPA